MLKLLVDTLTFDTILTWHLAQSDGIWHNLMAFGTIVAAKCHGIRQNLIKLLLMVSATAIAIGTKCIVFFVPNISLFLCF